MKKLELLAPAKNLELGIAAINSGADALYIGAELFGARASAGNTVEDIIKLINYAHLFHVKVYLTLNTILYDDEIQEAMKLINKLYAANLDAIIIQDMGLLELNLPPIKIIASTQTNNHTIEKVKFLENVGFARVILARELLLKEIQNIKKETNIELEFFVHGALCVSYSGQCYFSHEITGRSANRGECAQPCRSAYDLVDADGEVILKDKHLFSLKDFNLSEKIDKLANAGISSFKIEGRLKNISYVKNVTAYYRNILDRLIKSNPDLYEQASSGTTILTFKPNIDSVFNRGFTNYFIDGRKDKMASFDTPKSIGEYIGKVNKIIEDSIFIQTEKTINNNDGLCFFQSGKLFGVKVNKTVNNEIVLDNIGNLFINAEIYRNYNHLFTKEVEKENSAKRRIQISLELSEIKDKIRILIVDEDNIKSETYMFENLQEAKNKEKATETIKNQLSKEGGSIYQIREIKINTSKVYFFPVSRLNEIRRKALEQHSEIRIKKHSVEINPVIKNNIPFYKNEIDYNENISNQKAEEFYQRHGVTKIKPAFEKHKIKKSVPILTSRYCLKYELGACPKFENFTKLTLKEPLYIMNNKRKYRLSFDCTKCEMSINS